MSLLRANLERVFNERDSERRLAAARTLFAPNAVMYEPTALVEGPDAIAAVAGKLLEQFGADFAFVPDGNEVGHHGLAVLRWHAGPPAITGADAAEIADGRITHLWVLLDPT